MSQAELVIKSDSVTKTTEALERLISRFEQLDAAAEKVKKGSDGVDQGQTKIKNALDQTAAAQTKAIALMDLERQGLDKNSSQYAKLRAEILAKDLATRKGIATDTEDYKVLLKNVKAKELATAKTKQLATAQKDLKKQGNEVSGGIKSFTNTLDDLSKQASLVDGPLGGVASRITTLSGILKNVGGAGAIAFAGVGIAVALFTRELSKGLSVAMDAEVQMRTFEAQVRATGGAAGISANQMDLLSRSLAMSTLDNRKGVADLITVMTSFGNVSGKAFERSISLAQDLGVTMKIGSVGAARALGKALENPMENYSQLSRMGVEFNDEEKKKIALLQQTGKIYEAQSIILDKLDAKTGGAAKRQADSLAGDLDTFGQKWEEAFERAAKNALPLSREVTQIGIELLDIVQILSETDVETNFRTWRDSVDLIGASTEELNKQLDDTIKKQEELASGSVQSLSLFDKSMNTLKDGLQGTIPLWGQIYKLRKAITDEVDTDTLSVTEQEIALEKKKAEALKESLDAKSKATTGTAKLSDEQKKYIDQLSLSVTQQTALTDAYLKSGDTRSEYYQNVKAGIDAENAANKVGLGDSKERVAQIKENMLALSKLTEQRVIENTVLQKTKALRNKSQDLQQESDFYEILRSGVEKNSHAYILSTAAIMARNSAISAAIPLGGAEEDQIRKSTVALLEQQKALSIISALKATDSNSSTVQSLQRTLELQDVINSGVVENTKEYFKSVAAIDTRNTASRLGLDINSKEYEQLLKQNLAIADMRNQIQQVNNLKEVGLEKDMFGKVIATDTRAAILANGDSLRTTLDELLSSGEIDKDLYSDKIESLKSFFNEGLKELTIPLGITIDSEGQEVLMESIEGVEVEKQEKLKELDMAFKEGLLQDESTYLERRNELIREYDEKLNEQRLSSFDKTSQGIALIRSAEVAGNVKSIADNISAASGGSKKMAKISKAAAMFQASAGLVKQLSAAASVEPYYAKFAAYAEAAATGASIINMASGLKDPSFAFGGVDIQGRGTGRSDSIKANIASGESVITAPATARHKDTLRRMNAGLPLNTGGGKTIVASPQINIQGDASENTISLIDKSLRDFENRVQQIAQGVSMQTIQEEQQVGGLFDPI